jgi:pyruvate-formate lyase
VKQEANIGMEGMNRETGFSERIGALKNNLLTVQYEFDIERARYFTESYMKTESQLPCMRAAKGLEETLRRMTISIDNGEILVGAKAKKISAPLGVERGREGYDVAIGTQFHGKDVSDLAFLDVVSGRSPDFMKNLTSISEKEYKELTEDILPYWRNRDLSSFKTDLWKNAGLWETGDPVQSVMAQTDDQGHVTLGLKKVLDLGFMGIAAQAAMRLAALDSGTDRYQERRDFLESVQVAAAAVCDHAARYARLAEDMAGHADGKRRKELMEIADRCRRVPAGPARSFMDALQSIWMTQAVTLISYGEDAVICPGRIDQFLYQIGRAHV